LLEFFLRSPLPHLRSNLRPPYEESMNLADSAFRLNLNCWRHVGSEIPKSGPEAKILLNQAQVVPKGSPSFCLKG
jgi:hypothetical protein